MFVLFVIFAVSVTSASVHSGGMDPKVLEQLVKGLDPKTDVVDPKVLGAIVEQYRANQDKSFCKDFYDVAKDKHMNHHDMNCVHVDRVREVIFEVLSKTFADLPQQGKDQLSKHFKDLSKQVLQPMAEKFADGGVPKFHEGDHDGNKMLCKTECLVHFLNIEVGQLTKFNNDVTQLWLNTAIGNKWLNKMAAEKKAAAKKAHAYRRV